MNSRIELCCLCNDPTGRAGRHDDSLYLAEGTPAELGPLCVTCHNTLSNADRIAELEQQLAAERERANIAEAELAAARLTLAATEDSVKSCAQRLRERVAERDALKARAEALERAVEFGGYLAAGAEQLQAALNAVWFAQQQADEADSDDEIVAAETAIELAEADRVEAFSGLTSDIYEFRKRAARAQKGGDDA